ncbi:MAG TPA: hypothetical protein VNX88_14550 [Terriglobales bacterium]|nr:hypothetical protein [Terriglobales bacterium]
MSRYAVLITYREVVGRESKLLDLLGLLAKYQRNEVIFLLAKLNCVLGTWQNNLDFDVDAKLTRTFLPSYSKKIDQIRSGTNFRILFSRIGLLYLVKQSSIACAESGLWPKTEHDFEAIGLACLMANDLMLPFVPSPQDGTLEKLANTLPFSDYVPHDQYPMEIARARKMFEMAASEQSLRSRSDFVPVNAEFEKAMGNSYTAFSELVFGCATKFLNVRLEDLPSPEAMILRGTFFQKSAIPPDKAKRFFDKITIPEPELANKIRSSSDRPGDDLTLFQAHPLIEVGSSIYTCLDPGFLVGKAGRGLFWTIFSELESKQRSRLFSFWGAVFELYVNSIMSRSYKAGGRFIAEPKFKNGDQAFDACLLEGQRLLTFEHKSSTIRADCKYGGDVAKLRKELHLKFIDGDDEGAKGVAQLSKSISRFLDGERIEGICHSSVTKIYPILICLDDSVSVPYLGKYFNEQFDLVFQRDKFAQTVSPVFTLNVSDVESVLGYLNRFMLSDILDSFYSQNQGMFGSLSRSEVPLLKNVEPGPNLVRQDFAEFGRRIEKDLFPDEADSKPTSEDAALRKNGPR